MRYYNQRDHFSYHQLYFFSNYIFNTKHRINETLHLRFKEVFWEYGKEPSELGKMTHM